MGSSYRAPATGSNVRAPVEGPRPAGKRFPISTPAFVYITSGCRKRASIAARVALALLGLATPDARLVVDTPNAALRIRVVAGGAALLNLGRDADHGGFIRTQIIVIVGRENAAAEAEEGGKRKKPCSAERAEHGGLRFEVRVRG